MHGFHSCHHGDLKYSPHSCCHGTLYTASIPVTSHGAAKWVAQGSQGSGGSRSHSALRCTVPSRPACAHSFCFRWKGVLHILLCDSLVRMTPSSGRVFWVIWTLAIPKPGGMLAQGPATYFQVQNRVVKRRHLFQDPDLHVGERVSFLLQTPPTTTGHLENGLKQVFKGGIYCKNQEFLSLFFLVSERTKKVKIGMLVMGG